MFDFLEKKPKLHNIRLWVVNGKSNDLVITFVYVFMVFALITITKQHCSVH